MSKSCCPWSDLLVAAGTCCDGTLAARTRLHDVRDIQTAVPELGVSGRQGELRVQYRVRIGWRSSSRSLCSVCEHACTSITWSFCRQRAAVSARCIRLQEPLDPKGEEELEDAVLVQGRWLCIVNNPHGDDSAWAPVYIFDVQTLVWQQTGWGALRSGPSTCTRARLRSILAYCE